MLQQNCVMTHLCPRISAEEYRILQVFKNGQENIVCNAGVEYDDQTKQEYTW